MTQLDANVSRFSFIVRNISFPVYKFRGKENICTPYEFTVEFLYHSPNVDITALSGMPACLHIVDDSEEVRFVHGIIREVQQLHTGNASTHYRAILVPRLWFLDRITDHRIFQNLSVPDIINDLLKEQGFSATTLHFNLWSRYEPREYCVQYGESDLNFITRLCEEEGIYYYFEHKEDAHCLCFCDREGGPKISGESDLRFFPGSGQRAEGAVISRLHLYDTVNGNAAAFREWNFTRPRLNLDVWEKETDAQKAPVPQGMHMERYVYPHGYKLRAEGQRYAKLQVQRQLVFRKYLNVMSSVCRFLPGYTFNIHDHPRRDVNARWWTVGVRHHGEQPGVLEHEASSERGLYYEALVRAIPATTRFVPTLHHPKRRVEGVQTAIVVGPKGEEIYPDEYGRVKVRFHWDRKGGHDEKSGCWIRVSQGWAGAQYGTIAIPRIGHEVVVSFLEGDPDRPLITGRVHHDLNKVPYELPANKTRTTFKSMSTPGKEGEPRGFNELRVEDKKGEEEIYLHGEKDVGIHVKNIWKEKVMRDVHVTAGRNVYALTKGETNKILCRRRKTELRENDSLVVHGDNRLSVDGNWLCNVGKEAHLKSGAEIIVEANVVMTLKAGGSWIRLSPMGVSFGGARVGLNSGGSAGSAADADPDLPDAPSTPEEDSGSA